MGIRLLSLGTALTLCLSVSVASGVEDAPVGKKVEGFTANDFRGQEVSLADFAGSKAVVIAVVGTECPQAKLYASRLVDLAKRFESHGVAFLAIDSNQQDSVSDLAHYAKEHQIEFPLLKDTGNKIADQLGAVRTPEAFLLDADRVIRYWGRIDDQYGFQTGGVAYQREIPQREDLAIAIEEVLAGQPVTLSAAPSQGCHIGRVKEPLAGSDVTYTKHIATILNNNCVYCHREKQIAPFSLTNYEDAVGWAEMVREVVNDNRMPPWHADPAHGKFSNDARLSDEDKALINKWVDNGAPEGDPNDLPAPPRFAEGWQIPEPDEVVWMPKEYEVPATGTVEYQRFIVDPGWNEDKWIKAMECRPGNASVVHHIIVYLVPSGVTPTGQAGRLRTNWLGAFAPGLRPQVLSDDMARYVQKGTKLLFEMHYTPNGKAQKDRSYVGFKFADPSKVQKEVAVQNAGNFTFKIPPGHPNYKVEADYIFRQNSLLLSVSPHMHVRGKDFRYDLIFPDGRKETILWVPRYDFGWQTTYMLEEPRQLPRGTRLHCVAHFDNSEDNRANPDPTKEVTWGEQTWEEMMFGWFEVALADQDLTKPATENAQRVKEFLAAADTISLDEQIKALVRNALKDDKSFEIVSYQLMDLVPQVDRICVTGLEKDRIRLKFLQERLGLDTSFKSKSTVIRANGQSLADYIQGNEIVVNQSLEKTQGSVMVNMSRKDIRSSLHVPVEIDGARATINFWSSEAGAFPAPAVKILEEIARLMAEGPTKVATNP